MKTNYPALILSAIAAALATATFARAFLAARTSVPASEAAPVDTAEAAGYPLEDKMNQLHRLADKLGRALDRENLTLATFYHHEMDAIAEEIVVHGVIHEDRNIGYLASLELQPPLAYLESSLERLDLAGSRAKYRNLLTACNVCHAKLGIIHPPIVPPPPLELE